MAIEFRNCSLEGGLTGDASLLRLPLESQTFTTSFTLELKDFSPQSWQEVVPSIQAEAVSTGLGDFSPGRSFPVESVGPVEGPQVGRVGPGDINNQNGQEFLLGLLPGTHDVELTWSGFNLATPTGIGADEPAWEINLNISVARATNVHIADDGAIEYAPVDPRQVREFSCGTISIEAVTEPPLDVIVVAEPTTSGIPRRGEQSTLTAPVTNRFDRPITVTVNWYYQDSGATITTAQETIPADSTGDVQTTAVFGRSGDLNICAQVIDAQFANSSSAPSRSVDRRLRRQV